MTAEPMPKRLLDHCIEDRDRHGNVRIYLRRPGQRKVRLHGVPWTETFMEAYRLALRYAAAGRQRQSARAGEAGHLALALRGVFRGAGDP